MTDGLPFGLESRPHEKLDGDDDWQRSLHQFQRGEVCRRCGGRGVVKVWDEEADWEAGEEPDYLGCMACNTMEEN